MPDETRNERIDMLMEELKSKGIVMATVKDGKCFFFSKAVIQEMLDKVNTGNREYVYLFVKNDNSKPTILN